MAISSGGRLDMGTAWNDAMAMLREHQGLLLPIAGVFMFLPALAVNILMPAPPPPTGASLQVMLESMRPYLMQTLPYQIGAMILGIIGQIACSHVILGSRGTSVGRAIQLGFTLFPGVLLASLISGLAMGIGFLIFILPAFYLYARFSMIVPHAAATSRSNPIGLLSDSWALTANAAWTILGFVILVALIGFIAIVIFSAITGALFALLLPAGIANILSLIINGLTACIYTLVMLAALAAVYRQIIGESDEAVFA